MSQPIRVLQIVTYMGRGGLESMLMNYYRHINRTKVQFDFLVHRDFKADYDDEILSLGGKIHHISRLVPWSGAYKKELKNFFLTHPEYKIVHVHQDCLSSVALKCAKECGVPVRIAHSHSSSAVKNLKYPIKLYYMKKIYKYATDLLACGKQAGDWMFCGHTYQVVKNAIDLESYQLSNDIRCGIRKKLNVENKLVLGHVGRFREEKNHTFLIDVFNEVKKISPNSALLLVGDGELQEEVQQKVNSLGLSKDVIFTGSRSDVNQLMQAMDIFVFPSLYEGLPLTMVEAQSSGLPCLISNNIPDECILVQDLVKKKNITDSAADWAKMICSTSLDRKQYSEAITKTGYNIKYEAEKLQDFYLNSITKEGR